MVSSRALPPTLEDAGASSRGAAPSLWEPCAAALRRNVRPGLALQAVALGIVLAYSLMPTFRSLLDQIGALKLEYGYAYSAVMTAVFGGAIPFTILLVGGQVRRGERWRLLAFLLLFWCWKGAEVDALYRLQAVLFGAEASAPVIAAKTVFDQFVYGPLWAAPTQMILYLWKDAGFSVGETRRLLHVRPWWQRVAIILMSAWGVWIPAVAIIYSLPVALQIPLANVLICFWALLLNAVSQQSSRC